MSPLLVLLITSLFLNVLATVYFVRGWRASTTADLRRYYLRTRSVAAMLLFIGIPLIAIALFQAHTRMEHAPLDQKARVLAEEIAAAMKLGPISGLMSVPAIVLAIVLWRRQTAAKRKEY